MDEKTASVQRGCGVDIDSRMLWATVFTTSRRGITRWKTESFENNVRGIKELVRWLKSKKVTHVAFESTGIYWKQLYRFLEDDFEVLVANPKQIKQLKGRKTDPNDSKHIANLLRVDAISPSYVPPREIRELRDIVRQKQNFIRGIVNYKNRIIKTLREAGINLDTVMSDVFCKSGRMILDALIDGRSPAEAAKHAKGSLRRKIPQILEAVRFPLSEHYREILRGYWESLTFLERMRDAVEVRIEEKVKPYVDEIERLCTIPGIGRDTAIGLISELGVDMSRFPTEKHLASWAKVCPGNNSSGGKRKSGKNSKGNAYLQKYLGEGAWGAIRKPGSEFRRIYLARCARLGKKKTIGVIMHKLLRIVYNILLKGTVYLEDYEIRRGNDPRESSVRKALRKLTNEDLVLELHRRVVLSEILGVDTPSELIPG